jgi:plastocyanin
VSLCLAAVAAGAALALAVASSGAAAPDTASIEAYDYGFKDPDTNLNSTTVAMGGTVAFSYPAGGTSSHNIVFDTSQPSSCTQTAGADVGPVPPLPAAPSGAGWAGTCTFNSAGRFAFHCGLHAFMTGAVEVVDPNAPATGTTAPPGETQPTPGELAPPGVKVAHRQRGTVVRGSVTTPAGPSHIVVRAFVAKRAPAARARQVRIGSVTKDSKGTGKTAFALRINRAARRALHRRHRLAVNLRIAVTPAAGPAVTKTVAVTLREKT